MCSFQADEEEQDNNNPTFGTVDDENKRLVKVNDDEDLLSRCVAVRNALPFQDPETGETRCFDIGSPGPCLAENEWFVLDPEPDAAGAPRGVCRVRDCLPPKVLLEGECVTEQNRAKCPEPGKEVLIDPFGNGVCNCRQHFLPFITDAETGEYICYASHLTGPCEPGLSQYQPDEESPAGASCIEHDCPAGEIRWREDNECRKELDCGDLFDFRVDPKTGESSCVVGRQIITIPKTCPDGQTQNHDGECREVVRLFGSSGSSRPTRRLALGSRTLSSFLNKRFGGK